MKLYLRGHDYKYAVEQMMLCLFPAERPEYPNTPPDGEELSVEVNLSYPQGIALAQAVLRYRGDTFQSVRSASAGELTDPLATNRALQRILKLAVYDAALPALGQEPPWGALTGVRPVKIPTRAMERGATPAQAETVLEETYRVSPLRRRLAMDCAAASLAAKRSLGTHEISLYVGIPFCPTRCAYCSFVSADVTRSLKLVDPFLETLHQEISAAGALLRRLGRSIRTVYIGGGTPTTLSALQLENLMAHLSGELDLSHCTEYTVEAGRPDTITAEKLSAIRRGGAKRISVNPQSMSDGVLSAMGRAHTSADLLHAFGLVRDAGLSCINMDLIAGLPTDTPDGFRASLDQVLALGPENITVHTLALKKGSRLMEEGSALPTAEDVSTMLEYAWSTLRDAGQIPYYLYRQKYMSGSFENVGWCIPGQESLYNICMMEELHTILSLGGGGITKLIHPHSGHIQRVSNPKYPLEYIGSAEKTARNREQMAEFYAALEKEATSCPIS